MLKENWANRKNSFVVFILFQCWMNGPGWAAQAKLHQRSWSSTLWWLMRYKRQTFFIHFLWTVPTWSRNNLLTGFWASPGLPVCVWRHVGFCIHWAAMPPVGVWCRWVSLRTMILPSADLQAVSKDSSFQKNSCACWLWLQNTEKHSTPAIFSFYLYRLILSRNGGKI